MAGTYFFSFRSPYSWIASRVLQPMMERGEVDIDLIPFWEPDELSARLLAEKGGCFPYRAMSEAKHRYILMDVRRLTRTFGLQMAWPVDVQPWWDLSHLAWLKARDMGFGMPFFWAVYRARWEQGRDISDPVVIRGICEEIGADARAIAGAEADPEIRAAGAECLYRIYRDDVFGVPYFMVKRDRFWGIDRLPLFIKALTGRSYDAMEFVADKERGFIYESDHAGGCG